MSSFTDSGLIIRRVKYGETDLIISLLTQRHGRLSAIAKGSRKITSRRAGHLDLFNLVEFQVRESRWLPVITEARILLSFDRTKSDPNTLKYLYYWLELIERLVVEGDENRMLFLLLVDRLKKLELSSDRSTSYLEKMTRDWEISVLRELGFWSDESQGLEYPASPLEQKEFNRRLIEDVIEGEIKSARVLSTW